VLHVHRRWEDARGGAVGLHNKISSLVTKAQYTL
jgi:hypothetical protein